MVLTAATAETTSERAPGSARVVSRGCSVVAPIATRTRPAGHSTSSQVPTR